MSLPSLVVVHGAGSASPLDVIAAAEGIARVTFAVPVHLVSSEYMRSQTPLLRELGPVVEVDLQDPASAGLARAGTDGVVTFSDDGIATCVAIADLLGLPSIGRVAVGLLRDKYQQRTQLQAAGLGVPQFMVPTPDAPSPDGLFPAILKPRSGFGSRMTFPVAGRPELADLLQRAALEGFEPSDLILESLLVGDPSIAGPAWGDYVSVESAVIGGEVVHVGVSGRFPLTPPFRETGMVFPAPVDEDVLKLVVVEAAGALQALGVQNAMCHTELKLTPDGPSVIEVNGRIGGLTDTLLFHPHEGALVRTAMRIALGERAAALAELDVIRKDGVGYHISIFPDAPGRIVSIGGVESMGAHPGVESVRVLRHPGEIVTEEMGTFGETVLIMGTGRDHDSVLEVLRVARETIRIKSA